MGREPFIEECSWCGEALVEVTDESQFPPCKKCLADGLSGSGRRIRKIVATGVIDREEDK